MIFIDVLFNLKSFIIFLPFFSYLLKEKRRFVLYFLYGILLDLILLNKVFLNTFILILIYNFFPKRKKYLSLYFFISYNILFLANLIFFQNIFFIFTSGYIISLIINVLFYASVNKNCFF